MVRVVNTNVQSPVPLKGRGHTQRDSKVYDSGEYPVLQNTFITERGLESRYGITSVGHNVSSYGGALNASKFYTDVIGYIGSHRSVGGAIVPMVAGKNCFFGHAYLDQASTFTDVKWDPETLVAGQTNTKFQIPVKAFTYQDRNVVVTMRANEVASVIASFDYHWGQQASGAGIPALNLIVNRPVSGSSTDQDFVDAFAWKDRLWLVTRDTIYFSGIGTVANHQNFTAPVGGFIKYPGRIKAVEYLKDSLYVICEREIYVLTYNTDPNTDAVNIAVSSNQGGDSSCIHENTVYFTDGTSLFTVTSGGISKVLDFEIFARAPRAQMGNNTDDVLIQGKQISTKLIAYKNKIVLMFYDMAKMGGGVAATPYLNRGLKLPFSTYSNASYISKGTPPEVYAEFFAEFSNVFMIDMGNGSITKIMYRDQREPGNYNGFIVDALVVPDSNGDQVLYLMSSAHRRATADDGTSFGTAYTTHNHMYIYRGGEINDNYPFGGYADATGVWDSYYTVPIGGGAVTYLNKVVIPYMVFIKKFVPDGNEYMMKKFRTLLLMGNLPEKTQVYREFRDVINAGTYLDKYNVLAPSSVLLNPKPYRIALNQRSRWISICIRRESNNGANTATVSSVDTPVNAFRLFIEDIRLLWTYTGKPQRTVGGKIGAIL